MVVALLDVSAPDHSGRRPAPRKATRFAQILFKRRWNRGDLEGTQPLSGKTPFSRQSVAERVTVTTFALYGGKPPVLMRTILGNTPKIPSTVFARGGNLPVP